MSASLTPDDLRSALPKLDGILSIAGLAQSVTVFRDAQGVPRIRAQTEHQHASWAEARMVPMIYSWDRIEAAADKPQTLVPL